MNEKNKLEEEVKFSWMRVAKQGIKNMKDDLDPIYKGAKIGVYALHGIPTWKREYEDGRLANDSHSFTTIVALAVAGVSAGAYYIATQEAIMAKGAEGYGVLGIPLALNAASYTREAFRRAKKTEMLEVFKTRLQKKMAIEDVEGYDLTINDMMKSYMTTPPTAEEENQSRRTNYGISTKEKPTTMDAYKRISGTSEKIFNELFAFDQVGNKYILGKDLTVISAKNVNKEIQKHADTTNRASEMIWNTISQKGGSANIELLGHVTAKYVGEGDFAKPYYEVEPSTMWKI